MDAHSLLFAAGERMATDRYQVSQVQLPAGPAVVGYRSTFRFRWFATKLHLFTVVIAVPVATAETLRTATVQAIDYAKESRGRLRGLQSGVAAVPVLLANDVSPDAVLAAEERPPKGFAAMTLPAVVDLRTRATHTYDGRLIWGGVYGPWLRERRDLVLDAVRA